MINSKNSKVVVLMPAVVSAFFDQIFEQMHQQQIPEPQWPNGVGSEPTKAFNWLKGTTWNWNDWREVQFQQDGSFDAPTRECQHKACKWTSSDKTVYIWWGDAGLHVMKPSQMEAAPGVTMSGKRKADNQRQTAKFERIHDEEAAQFDDDLYEKLGVDVEADEQTIKKAYRKLSVKYHPDKCQDADCRKMFNQVRDAYEILSDKEKKILYDTGGRQSVKDAEKGQVQKGNDVNVEISVSLADLYTGNSVETSLQRRIVCVGCDQDRYVNSDRCRRCGQCPAEHKTVMKQMGPGMFMQQQVQVQSRHKCTTENTAIEATIEKGMDNGHTIKFAMMAEQRPGIVPGDVIFTVKTKKHNNFERKGKNLWMTAHISVKEALLGFTRTVKHLDGHEVTFEREGVTRPEFVMKIEGEGMPVHNVPAEYGAMFVKFVVDYPRELSSKQKQLVAQVFEDERDEL
jgi:DnaJ-class molecular chaperone